jgi:3-dehydrosphinganine reductase
MDINYWATAYLAHATLTAWTQASPPFFTSDPPSKHPRHFITTSSVLAFCGVAGYAPYSPPKSAQRSLIDTLRSEIALYNGARLNADVPTPEIKLHAVFPGTIRSPGHAQEQRLKHPITGILEEGDPTQGEDEVALAAVKGLEKGDFLVATQGLGALLRWGALGSSARNGWIGFRDVLGSSVVSVLWCILGPQLEGKVFRWGKNNGVRPDARMKGDEN